MSEPLGIQLDQRRFPVGSSPIAEQIYLSLSGKKDLQEAYSSVLAGLVTTQQHEVVVKPGLGHQPDSASSIPGEPLDCILGVVVIPGDAIIVDESEKFVAVSQ